MDSLASLASRSAAESNSKLVPGLFPGTELPAGRHKRPAALSEASITDTHYPAPDGDAGKETATHSNYTIGAVGKSLVGISLFTAIILLSTFSLRATGTYNVDAPYWVC